MTRRPSSSTQQPAIQENDGLRVVAYPGANKVLLAMSLLDDAVGYGARNLAGFAIWRTAPGQTETALQNRLTFDSAITAIANAAPQWTDSDKAPFQKFRWVDYPPFDFDAPFAYRVRALFFAGNGTDLADGPEVRITVAPVSQSHSQFQVAFTRGYIASQAYADLFHNKPIRPAGAKVPDFDTRPYQAQYQWLGSGARRLTFDFLEECTQDRTARIDFFAYDLDEPDVIAAICGFGRQQRLRAILDNAPLHTKASRGQGEPPEVAAAKMIIDAAGAENVLQGHFGRYQHNKVILQRDKAGTAQKVVFGSMNFSIRGVYVQANNIIVSEDPTLAGLFAEAFDAAFSGGVKAPAFRGNAIAASYQTIAAGNSAAVPKAAIAFAPHADPDASLGPMAQRIQSAGTSVLFAVMEPTGQGPVLDALRSIAAQPTIFSYGTVETSKGLAVQSPDGAMGDVTGFAALTRNVPPPFKAETSGGPGMHIHDKFVVVDFNSDNPTVFTGSSNLAAGGENQNGDNLIMIEDAGIAAMYAIEAVAMFDHYHFNKKAQEASRAQPLGLWYPGRAGAGPAWWKQYYDPRCIQMRDRLMFAAEVVPASVTARKAVRRSSAD